MLLSANVNFAVQAMWRRSDNALCITTLHFVRRTHIGFGSHRFPNIQQRRLFAILDNCFFDRLPGELLCGRHHSEHCLTMKLYVRCQQGVARKHRSNIDMPRNIVNLYHVYHAIRCQHRRKVQSCHLTAGNGAASNGHI